MGFMSSFAPKVAGAAFERDEVRLFCWLSSAPSDASPNSGRTWSRTGKCTSVLSTCFESCPVHSVRDSMKGKKLDIVFEKKDGEKVEYEVTCKFGEEKEHAFVADIPENVCLIAFKEIIAKILSVSTEEVDCNLSSLKMRLDPSAFFPVLRDEIDADAFDLKVRMRRGRILHRVDMYTDFDMNPERGHRMYPLFKYSNGSVDLENKDEGVRKRCSLPVEPDDGSILKKASTVFGQRIGRVALYFSGRTLGEVRDLMSSHSEN
mmetsp:Transcript_17720/g.43984  ORF Transcript_17720/g.43984 Transcript_17720/m.43984 type:complete len:262 (-) Transcript_17720:584-1369(-)